MALKMANGSSVFSPLTPSKIGDRVHFESEGMGLKHYFYRIDTKESKYKINKRQKP